MYDATDKLFQPPELSSPTSLFLSLLLPFFPMNENHRTETSALILVLALRFYQNDKNGSGRENRRESFQSASVFCFTAGGFFSTSTTHYVGF